MKKKSWWISGLSVAFFIAVAAFKPSANDKTSNEKVNNDNSVHVIADSISKTVQSVYEKIGLASKGLAFETFRKAYNGYHKLVSSGKIQKQILTIADMSQPSCQKRLYIIDMAKSELLVNTLVAHGRNSGEATAARFSNIPESLQSSLGFYVTGNTYSGSNGYSMKLFGMEKGFNDKAESRAIVMHGAAYVNEEMAKKIGRIGRSWGCPAVSLKEHQQIINLVKEGSCLYLFAPQKNYLAQSSLSNDNGLVL